MMFQRTSKVARCINLVSLGLFSGLILNGCGTTSNSKNDCVANFSTQGSFLTGKQFYTSETVGGVTGKMAYERLYKILVSDGYYIQSADERLGIISAYQNVNLSDKTASLNAIVKKSGSGVEVGLTFVASAGIYTPEGGAREEFCRIIHRVKN